MFTGVIEAVTEFAQATGITGLGAFSLLISGGLVWVLNKFLNIFKEITETQSEAAFVTSEALYEVGKLLNNIDERQKTFTTSVQEIKQGLHVHHLGLTEIKVRLEGISSNGT